MEIEVLSWPELVRRAGSPGRARTGLAGARWKRVLRDAYVGGWHDPDDPAVKVAALRAVLPPDVAVSHRAALWLLGLDVLRGVVDVTVPRGRHLEQRRAVAPHTAALVDDELCEVDGLLVVSAARAFVDVARCEPLVEAVVVGDAVLRAGVAREADVLAVVEAARGLRGVRRARAVLPHLEPRSESPMESRFRMRLVLGGVPRPEAQVDVYDADGHVGRVDLHLRGVALEYDGRAARLDRDVFVRERRRQTRLAETGLELRRFTSADYYGRPGAAVCAEVLRAVAQAATRDRSRLRTGPDTLPVPRVRPLPTLAQARRAA